ncbi:glycosyltransferase family 1 protein [Uliginosibacterium sediminicola]|uniref:Glycosyltransferase family 1 protein n=1 Tax=Uliginosibacterium sediminicola TaxID=2024550 RepID=A0ABU9YWK5_9RHOO
MNRPLRISLVTETWPPEVNGVAMTVSRLVEGLRERGHQVQVVRPRQRSDGATQPDTQRPDVLMPGLPLPGYNGLQFGLPAGRSLRRLWESDRPDVVHAVTEGPLGWSALSQARALRLPITSSYHTHFDGYSKHYGAGIIGPVIGAVLRRFHRRTLSTMAPTRVLVDSLSRAKVPGARLLGRGVDVELFQPARRSQALRERWGAGDEDLVVLNVGRLAAEKNLKLAARAFEAILAKHPRAKMVWVGDGPSRATLAKQFPAHVFTGAKRGEELATHYASADIFLFPSLTETYGNVVPEAMASGLAVVSYHDAAAAELISSGVHGLTVAAGDEQAFVAAAVQMADDSALRHTARIAARARVEPITWEAVISEFESVLRAASRGELKPD